ncbi:histidine triad nucleotide-binding protein [Gemmatimonas sp.]|uniref:histidine triad nucleotide-binding protein n=1 Tax=Gemmatimonas sp. TaxID=1962908 RepID=UPI0027BAED14|nr:histidine triad nucleotide-binding protein [Gemmatimonas sp.]
MSTVQPDACIFCRIVAGAIPATVVASNAHALAFRDLHPQAPVHVLVVPRRHVASLATADDAAELGELLALAAEVARQEGIADAGYRVVTNIGADGGQTVGHLHLHVLGGRAMDWPPG